MVKLNVDGSPTHPFGAGVQAKPYRNVPAPSSCRGPNSRFQPEMPGVYEKLPAVKPSGALNPNASNPFDSWNVRPGANAMSNVTSEPTCVSVCEPAVLPAGRQLHQIWFRVNASAEAFGTAANPIIQTIAAPISA